MHIATTNNDLKEKILILEDNSNLIEIYQGFLSAQYDLVFATLISELTTPLVKESTFGLLIADVTLPDGDFLEWLMTSQSNLLKVTPTIIVSSMEDPETLRTFFEWGAIDYLIKPFNKTEVIVKIERILQNKTPIDFIQNAETFKDELTLIENKLFQLFTQTPGKILNRDDLFKTIWRKIQVNPKTLDVHLSNLRKKINLSLWRLESVDNGWKMIKKNP